MSVRIPEQPDVAAAPATGSLPLSGGALPVIGAAVDVVANGSVFAGRWESVTGNVIDVVVRGRQLPAGTSLELRWHSLRGISTAHGDVLDCEALQTRMACRLRVRLVGPVSVVQRRRAMRALGAGPVAVTPLDRRLAPVRSGSLLDIAEEGLRCRLAGVPLVEGQPVAVHVGLGDDVLELRGTVLRVTPAGDGYADAVIGFSPGESDSAGIRRFVYLQQVRLRRAGLL